MGLIGYGYGSEWHLTQYLAHRRSAFTRQVEEKLALTAISWLDSEERRDSGSGRVALREARGLEFLPREDTVRREWERRWPQTGNVHNWDAVGRTGNGDTGTWVLVEAKAHIGELTSSCSATSEDSRRRITEVLNQTRSHLGATGSSDWLTGYYQYCNRIALLHYLRERAVDAHLLFVYFTGDRLDLGSRGRDCPASEDAWQPGLDSQKRHAGIDASAPLLQFVHELFLPAYWASVWSDDPSRKESVKRS